MSSIETSSSSTSGHNVESTSISGTTASFGTNSRSIPLTNLYPSPLSPNLPSTFVRRPVNPQDGWDFYHRLGSPKHIVAPMVNQSELAFRILAKRYGAHVGYTPMIHAENFIRDPTLRCDVFTTAPEDRPVFAQWAGHNAQAILHGALHIQHMVDAIDMNFGCPQGIAKKGHYGAFLLEEPELLADIVTTLHQYLSIPVTCKMRILKTEEATLKLAKLLQDSGCYILTVHGRVKEAIKDRVGAPDYEMIRKIKQHLQIPVFANGGICDYNDVERCLRETGCDGVMSSEGLLCNPALFAGKRIEPIAMAREYMQLTTQYETHPSSIRAHLFKILYRNITFHTDMRARLGECNADEFHSIIDELERRDLAVGSAEALEAQYKSIPYWYSRWLAYNNTHEKQQETFKQRQTEQERLAEAEDDQCGFGGCMFDEETTTPAAAAS